jgi:hypothetical protein
MTFSISARSGVSLIVFISLLVQLGFALDLLGPAWLSPILSLPGLAALFWLWRREVKQNETAQAFERLVI